MRRLAAAALAALLLLPVSAVAQDEGQPRTAPRTDSPILTKGPCFDVAAASMPDGTGHDHLDLAAHRYSCGFTQEAFLPLDQELAARPDIVLGESDVQGDIAVVAVAYPEAGMLTFDVKDPARPEFLSWYRSGDCDFVLDVDCGAYVSLTDDGKMAFLSIQALSPLGGPGFNGTVPATTPGVQVISLDDPSAPLMVDNLPVTGVAGVHTSNYHVIPGDAGGEYLFSTANSVGIQISRVVRSGGTGKLVPVNMVPIDEVHDMFLQDDPIDGRTYMYVAAGFTSGFYVFDVTNPLQPELKAEWDLNPGDGNFYSHTMFVATRNGRRYVTMPTEGFAGQGHGEVPGLMWIVDATDFSKLGPADATDGAGATDPDLAANSQAALVATWHNAANAPAGDLTFSPHNQEIVDNTIYLSQYHGGVVALDATAAFAGRNERPHEIGVVVPHSGKRPLYTRPEGTPGQPFFSAFFTGHPVIWDMNYYKGHILAFDERGGMYSFKPAPEPSPPGPGGCVDATPPTARLSRARLTRRRVVVAGTATDKACEGERGRIARVAIAVSRRVGRKCAWVLPNGRRTKPRSCSTPVFQNAKGTSRFRLRIKARLPRGRYTVTVQAADAAGNFSRGPRRAVRLR